MLVGRSVIISEVVYRFLRWVSYVSPEAYTMPLTIFIDQLINRKHGAYKDSPLYSMLSSACTST